MYLSLPPNSLVSGIIESHLEVAFTRKLSGPQASAMLPPLEWVSSGSLSAPPLTSMPSCGTAHGDPHGLADLPVCPLLYLIPCLGEFLSSSI